MMPTEDETDKPNSEPGKETMDYYLSESSQKARSKRKLVMRSSSQPPSKARKRTGSESDEDLLHKLLLQMQSLQTEVGTLKTAVVDLKEELLNREPPINNEVLLEKISANTEFIRTKLEQAPAAQDPAPDQTATQQVLMDIVESEQTVEPVGVSRVRPSEVIPDWEDYIKKRKSAYSIYLNNKERHGIHVGWKSSAPPFTPPQYLPKELGVDRSESEREYEVRKKQRFNEWEGYMELLGVRRDDAQAEYQSIDSHIAGFIDSIDEQPAVKESLQEKYNRRVEADEAYSLKQWKSVEVGLVGKPERDSGKIVITDGRVYAKLPLRNKGLQSEVTKKETELVNSNSKKNKNQKPKRFTPDSNKTSVIIKEPYKHKGPYRKQETRQQYGGYMEPHLPAYPVPYQQCFVPPPPSMFQQSYPQIMPGVNFFQPGNMSQPPPQLANTQICQPENSSFHWGTSNHLLKQPTYGRS